MKKIFIFAPSNERHFAQKQQKMSKISEISVKSKAFALLLCLAVMLLTATNLNAQLYDLRGLFGRGIAPEEIVEGEDEEYLEYFMYYGYRGGLFNPTYGGYNIGTQIFGSDTDGGLNIYTQQFGYEEEETPLGSGCLVLTLAGAAYAFKKRKNNDKK